MENVLAPLPTALRPGATGDLQGGEACAAGAGNPPAAACDRAAPGAGGLRVRASRHGRALPVQRAAGRWRAATAREWRTQQGWAAEVAALLEGCYAESERVTLVLDNLDTLTPRAFYEAFELHRARAVAKPGDYSSRWHRCDEVREQAAAAAIGWLQRR